ncbi:unnamed protein product [Colias eurytheme]|nr:unnamed protein product [Colias eurytheme]
MEDEDSTSNPGPSRPCPGTPKKTPARWNELSKDQKEKHRAQKYRADWENLEVFKHWLKPDQTLSYAKIANRHPFSHIFPVLYNYRLGCDILTRKQMLFGFVELKGLDAKSIAYCIVEFLTKEDLNPADKCVGFGFDGCSTKSGKDGGMPARRKLSPRQVGILVEFAESHREIALGRFSGGPLANQATRKAWEEVAVKLNSVAEGSTKTPDQWRRLTAEEQNPSQVVIEELGTQPSTSTAQSTTTQTTSFEPSMDIEWLEDSPPLEFQIPPGTSHPDTHSVKHDNKELLEEKEQQQTICQKAPKRRTKKRISQDERVPHWAYELESKRLAVEERHTAAIEKLAVSLTKIQEDIHIYIIPARAVPSSVNSPHSESGEDFQQAESPLPRYTPNRSCSRSSSHRSTENPTTSVATVLKDYLAEQNRSRDSAQNNINVNQDPIIDFFMSMARTVQGLDKKKQLYIKGQLFQ